MLIFDTRTWICVLTKGIKSKTDYELSVTIIDVVKETVCGNDSVLSSFGTVVRKGIILEHTKSYWLGHSYALTTLEEMRKLCTYLQKLFLKKRSLLIRVSQRHFLLSSQISCLVMAQDSQHIISLLSIIPLSEPTLVWPLTTLSHPEQSMGFSWKMPRTKLESTAHCWGEELGMLGSFILH